MSVLYGRDFPSGFGSGYSDLFEVRYRKGIKSVLDGRSNQRPSFLFSAKSHASPGTSVGTCPLSCYFAVRAQWDRSPAHSSTWHAHDVSGVGLEVVGLKKQCQLLQVPIATCVHKDVDCTKTQRQVASPRTAQWIRRRPTSDRSLVPHPIRR